MASSYTPRLVLPEMASGEQSGYVTFNELSRILDALLLPVVQSMVLITPPGSLADGQIWFVAAGATGAWAGQDGKLAQWFNGQWYFYTRPGGTAFYDEATTARRYVDAANNEHFLDAPVDGLAYVKRDAKWETLTNKAVLYGNPNNATLGTGGFALVNWSGAADSGLMNGAGDASAGTITIPETGIYTLIAAVNGSQGNLTKEESMYLELDSSVSGITAIAHESVDTDKTDDRTLIMAATRDFTQNEVLNLRLRATATLGTFTFEGATFEISKLF